MHRFTATCGVSAIIPTAGGTNVRRCVAALRRAAPARGLQVVLAVTGGADELPACDDLVRVDPPFVWSKANNAALRVVRHPIVLLLNDDAFFEHAEDLNRLLTVMETWPYLAAVGPLSNNISRYFEQHSDGPVPGGSFTPTGRPLCGHCLLVRRECFPAVGDFDEGFDVYGGDELDWLYRAHLAGYRWGIDPSVFVPHLGSATFRERAGNWIPGIERFKAKHGFSIDLTVPWEAEQPELSWVIASNGGPRYLSAALDSIALCSQGITYEVVIAVDGHDPAPYYEVLRHYEGMPVRLFSFPRSAGVSEAKNRALRLAKGHALCFFDDDDIAIGNRRALLDALQHVELVYGEFRVRWLDGSLTRFPRRPMDFQSLLSEQPRTIVGPQCVALRREVADRYYFREDLQVCEDYELWLRLARDGTRIRHLAGRPVAIYLQRPNSLSRTRDLDIQNRIIQDEYQRWVPDGEYVSEPKYSYVIIAESASAAVRRSLDRIRRSAPSEPFEVIVALEDTEPAPRGDLLEVFGELPLRIHRFPRAFTPGLAIIRAWRQARGEYLLSLSAGDEETPGQLAQLLAALHAAHGDLIWTREQAPDREPAPREQGRGATEPGMGKPLLPALLLRRSVLDADVCPSPYRTEGLFDDWLREVNAAGFCVVTASVPGLSSITDSTSTAPELLAPQLLTEPLRHPGNGPISQARRAGPRPVLAATLLVRDEAEIVLQNIEHHLAQGVEFFIATDNGSVDGTLELLHRHPAVKLVLVEREQNFQQTQWVTRMAQLLCDYEVDWIVHLDADEFWWGFETLATVPPEIAVVKSGTALIPSQSSGETCREFVPMVKPDGPTCNGTFDRRGFCYYRHAGARFEYGVKVIHRPDPCIEIAQGNHDVRGVPHERQVCTTDIRIDHYPIRSYHQFQRKVINGGSAYARSGLPNRYGVHWREWYRRWQHGELQAVYEELSYTADAAEQACREGRLLQMPADEMSNCPR
jgi:GT2 family glycosyltransferase